MAQIIPFPVQRAIGVSLTIMPTGLSPHEEALFRVRQLRAKRAAYTPDERGFWTTQIMLEWWEGELGKIIAQRHASHNGRD